MSVAVYLAIGVGVYLLAMGGGGGAPPSPEEVTDAARAAGGSLFGSARQLAPLLSGADLPASSPPPPSTSAISLPVKSQGLAIDSMNAQALDTLPPPPPPLPPPPVQEVPTRDMTASLTTSGAVALSPTTSSLTTRIFTMSSPTRS